MKLRAVLRRALVVLTVIGLVTGTFAMPLSAPAMQAAAMADGDSSMPCHGSMPDRGKPCPFMAFCMALCCQSLPAPAATIVPPAPIAMTLPLRNDTQGDDFSPSPLFRPPRA